MRTKISLVLAAGALVAMAVGMLSPADAGPGGDVNTFRVVKVVDGPVPPGSVFEVEVVCTVDNPASPGTEAVPVTTLQFDEDGNPIGPDSVGVGFFEECHAEETVDNGAVSVTYSCQVAATNNAPAPEGNPQVSCVDDQTVHFGDVAGAEGTITVTNAFEAAPPPPPPPPPDVEPDDVTPDVVDATPPFTG